MAKKCCNKWKKKDKFCGSCPIPKMKRDALTGGKIKVKKGDKKVKKTECEKPKGQKSKKKKKKKD